MAWQAWHIAGLQRSKKLPPLRRMMMRDKVRRTQSPDEMLKIAKQWTLLLGGEVKGKPN